MAQKVKHIVFYIILLALLLPALQGFFGFLPVKPLNGDFLQIEKPAFSSNAWFEGSFQSSFDPWLEQNIGFHNSMVRLHNQIDYSLFQKVNAEGVVRGRNGQLYEYDYIRAWMGWDFVGEELLDKKLRQFRFLQQHLKDHFNTDLVLVLEPGKASVYPEDIPSRYAKAEKGKTNYEYMLKRATELGIHLIDLNAYFIKIKDTSSYPLFPKQGTHWSEFAMWYGADSLLNYIESLRGIHIPEIVHEGREISPELQSTDYDVGITLNLLCDLPHGPMPYPKYHFPKDTTYQKPNVLAIADSYYWNFFNTRIPKNLFNNEAFWYFYKKVYPDSYFGDKFVDELDLKAEVEKQDVIFFMTTERFMYMVDRGFVDDLYSIYGLNNDMSEITHLTTGILNDNLWISDIIKNARNRGISLGEMLDLEAKYLLWKTNPEKYYSLLGTAPIVNEIKSNAVWYAEVKKRAEENNNNPDERLMKEARYVLNTRYPASLHKYERIQELMNNIRSDSTWHANTLEKAARYFMTEEEMARVEAEYIYQIEQKAVANDP